MPDVVRALDLSVITRKYEKEDRGAPPYHPRMMVALLLYSCCVGAYSSRRFRKRCERDAAYRVIVGEDVPDFRTISDFRKLLLPELQGLFVAPRPGDSRRRTRRTVPSTANATPTPSRPGSA